MGHISAGSHIVPTVVTWERSKHLLLFLHNLALPDLQAQTSPTGTHREVSSPHVAAALLKFDLHPLKTPKASSAVQSILYSQPESVMEFYLLLCNLALFSSTLMFLMCASGILTLLMFLLCVATSSAVWKPWDLLNQCCLKQTSGALLAGIQDWCAESKEALWSTQDLETLLVDIEIKARMLTMSLSRHRSTHPAHFFYIFKLSGL